MRLISWTHPRGSETITNSSKVLEPWTDTYIKHLHQITCNHGTLAVPESAIAVLHTMLQTTTYLDPALMYPPDEAYDTLKLYSKLYTVLKKYLA
jgi:hypothetical protein